MPQKYYLHPAFGEIALKKNKLSKGLRITIRPTNAITVTFPWHLTYNDAIRFIQEKSEWISNSLKKIENIPGKKLFLPETEFKTFAHELHFERVDQGEVYVKVNREKIIVHYSDENKLPAEQVQIFIYQAIEKVLRVEALKYLPSRVDFYATKFGLKYNHVSVKKMRTRWGSCSSSGNLNFNIHLMRLPLHLIDYVILHELAHTKQHNHGANFWKLLEELSGNANELSREMKGYRTTIV